MTTMVNDLVGTISVLVFAEIISRFVFNTSLVKYVSTVVDNLVCAILNWVSPLPAPSSPHKQSSHDIVGDNIVVAGNVSYRDSAVERCPTCGHHGTPATENVPLLAKGNVVNASINNVQMNDSDLSNSKFTNVKFNNCDLRGVNLKAGTFTNVKFNNITVDKDFKTEEWSMDFPVPLEPYKPGPRHTIPAEEEFDYDAGAWQSKYDQMEEMKRKIEGLRDSSSRSRRMKR